MSNVAAANERFRCVVGESKSSDEFLGVESVDLAGYSFQGGNFFRESTPGLLVGFVRDLKGGGGMNWEGIARIGGGGKDCELVGAGSWCRVATGRCSL